MSILKVNTIQDKGGNTIISSDGSGVITPSFGTGKIGQVLSSSIGSYQSTTSASFSTVSGFSRTITPSATDSKIFVLCNLQADFRNGSGTSTQGAFHLFRDTTDLTGTSPGDSLFQLNIGNGNPDKVKVSGYYNYLDSPNTTSEITYSFKFAAPVSGSSTRLDLGSTITVMEVLA